MAAIDLNYLFWRLWPFHTRVPESQLSGECRGRGEAERQQLAELRLRRPAGYASKVAINVLRYNIWTVHQPQITDTRLNQISSHNMFVQGISSPE